MQREDLYMEVGGQHRNAGFRGPQRQQDMRTEALAPAAQFDRLLSY